MIDRVLPGLALCVLLLGLAPRGIAQTAEPVPQAVLQGWGVPEGGEITTVTRLRRNADLHFLAADAGPGTEPDTLRALKIFTLRTDSLHTVVVDLDARGPRRVEEFVAVSDILEDVHEDDQILERGRRPTPLSGTRYVAERTPAGSWTRTFVSPDEPTEEQLEALGEPFTLDTPQYPTEPVPVGHAWEVERGDLESLYGSLVAGATQRMTFQLDSTGTYLGRPAAFLSYGLDVTVDRGDGVIMRQNEVGMTVRLLDRFVDVFSQWQGVYRTERAGAFEDGQAYLAVMDGYIRGQTERLLLVPRGTAPGP